MILGLVGDIGDGQAWNFAKYVVGKDGQELAFFLGAVTPEDPGLRAAISKALAQ